MKFYVVQFSELPYPNIEKYVCVSSSWIRRIKKRRVRVAYPTEDPEKTKRRVENEEPFKNKWKLYKAYVKYDTDNYDEAEIWMDVMYAIESDEYYPSGATSDNTSTEAVKNSEPENNNVLDKNKPLIVDTEGNQSAPAIKKEAQSSNKKQPSNEVIPWTKNETSEDNTNTSTEQPITPCSGEQPKIEATEFQTENIPDSKISLESSSENPDLHEVSNQPSETQDINETCCVGDSDKRASLKKQSDTTFTIESLTNPLNNFGQPLQQKRISVVSDDFLFRGQVETLSKSTEINNDQASPHSDHNETLAVQIIKKNLMKYAEYQRAQQYQDITVNQNQMHPELLQDKQNRESSEVNHDDGQKTADHNIPTNTISAEQNSSNLANNFRQPFGESHESQRLSPLIDFSVEYWLANVSKSGTRGQVVSQQKDTGSGGIMRVNQETSSQNITSNIPTLQSVPSIPNQPYLSGQSTEEQDYNVTIQRDSNLNKIIITRSNEMECSNELVPARNVTNTSCAVSNSLSATNQTRKVSKRPSERDSLQATRKRSSQDSRASKPIVRSTTGRVPLHLLGYGTDYTNNQNLLHRPEQNLTHIPPLEVYPHYNYNLNTQEMKKSKSSSRPIKKSNRIDRRNGRKKITKTSPTHAQESSNLVNRSQQLPESLNEKQLAPIFREYLIQDPRTGVLYNHPSTGMNLTKYNNENTTRNKQCAKQNIPTFLNQSSQLPDLSPENQFAPIFGNCYRPNCTICAKLFGCPIHINDINQRPHPQINPSNTPPTVQNSSQSNHSYGSSSHGRQFLTVDQHQNRVSRIQQSLAEKTTIEYSTESTEMNAERPDVIQNSFHLPNATLRNSVDERFSSKLIVSSNQQSISQDMHLDRNINQNFIEQIVNSKDKTKESSIESQNYLNISKGSPIIEELLSPVYVDALDHEISTEETLAEEIDKTERNTNPKNKTTSIKKPINVVDKSNAIEIERLQNEFNDLYRKMDTTVSETYKMFNQIRDTYVDYVETLTKVMKRVNDYCEMRINSVSAPSKDIIGTKRSHTRNEEVKRSSNNKNAIENNCDEKDIVYVKDNDEIHEDPKKKCVHKRSSRIWNPYHGISMI